MSISPFSANELFSASEFAQAGMISTCREDAPGVPIYGYGNEPSGKYKKDIDTVLPELDGNPLVCC